MKISIIGTGIVGKTIAEKLNAIGYDVMIGTRDVDITLSRDTKDAFGNPPFKVWYAEQKQIKLATFSEALNYAKVIFNCSKGIHALEILERSGMALQKDKILVDITNPLDFSSGFPPTLSVCNSDSLGEQIQTKFPALKVVKTLNTMNCNIMVNPASVPGSHHVMLSGNDEKAKKLVSNLLESMGWRPDQIIDLGDITTARGTEMLLPLWVRLYAKFQHGNFNFQITQASS